MLSSKILQLLFVALIFLISEEVLLSQELPYYKNLAQQTTNPQLQLVALDSILSKEGRDDPEVFIKNSFAYIELAKELDSIEAAARKMIAVSYTLTSITNQPKTVLRKIDELLARKYRINDSFLLGSLYLKRGGANYRLDLEEATKDFEKAIEVYGTKDSIYKADAYLFNGQAYSNLGEFVPAGENFQKALAYFEALKDYEYMIFAQQGITNMYSMNGFYEKAQEERTKNISKIKELELFHQLPVMYYNQSLDYKKTGEKEKQLQSLLQANAAIDAEKTNLLDRFYIYNKLIEYYLQEGDLEAATQYFNEVESLHDPSITDLIYISHYSEIVARYHLAKNKLDSALAFSYKKLEAAQALKYDEDVIQAKKLLSQVYQAKGNYQKSLEYKIAYEALSDSVYNKTTANSLAYYQTLYETEKKEHEIIAQNASIQLLEKDNDAARKRLLFISLALILSFGVILLYRNRQQLKNKKILQEKFSQELLISQEEERKRISKDLHDGLGQQLLLIKNKLTQNKDPETKKMVENAIEEVRGISRDLHPFQLQELGITKAIEMTLTQIDENTSLFISSEIDNIDNVFDKKQEVNLYRIVQEALNNILKHAKAEASKVTLKKEIGFIVLEIKDNGIGFDFTEKFNNMRSLGLKTLLERTKFLNGHMKISSKSGQGTTLEFRFPTL